MEIFWFLLGALCVGIIWTLKTWVARKEIKLSWLSVCGMALDLFLLLFTLAWMQASFAERENQAGGMGLLIIGGLTLVIFFLTRRQLARDNAAE